jgi:hypothetical protein
VESELPDAESLPEAVVTQPACGPVAQMELLFQVLSELLLPDSVDVPVIESLPAAAV